MKKYHVSHALINMRLFPPSKVEDQAPQFFIPYPDEKLIHDLSSLGDTILNNGNFFIVKVGNL
ncbi:MAG: hypothetical protein NT096_11985 [Proteobacteria bacterium]|nr:hypothetical protein [Pseudomonadota bacterium]